LTKNKQKNIIHLNNYSNDKTLDTIRKHKRKKRVRIRIGLILTVGIILIGMAGLPLINNAQKTEEFNQLHVEAANDLEDLQAEKEQLEYQVGLLEDEEYIAKLARDELNLSKSNEILINLPEEDFEASEESEETPAEAE